MAQKLKGQLVKGPYKLIHRNCAMFFLCVTCFITSVSTYVPNYFPTHVDFLQLENNSVFWTCQDFEDFVSSPRRYPSEPRSFRPPTRSCWAWQGCDVIPYKVGPVKPVINGVK